MIKYGDKKYFTVQELAEILGISATAVERKINRYCKWNGIDKLSLIKTTSKGRMFLIPPELAEKIFDLKLKKLRT